MVYYKTGKGKNAKKYGVTIGAGPIKITSTKPTLRNQVKNVQRSVKEIQSKEELKYRDIYMNDVQATITPTLQLLNGMVESDDIDGRIGDQISPTSIQFRSYVRPSSDYIASDVVYRHIIFWDQQANGAAPSAGDVLDTATITQYVLAPYKRQYQKRFKIIYDKTHVLRPKLAEPNAATTDILQPVDFTKAKKSLSRVVKYRNAQSTGLINDIASNSLYSMWVCDISPGNGAIHIHCGYRMYFKDD